jgi:hypothetical protein
VSPLPPPPGGFFPVAVTTSLLFLIANTSCGSAFADSALAAISRPSKSPAEGLDSVPAAANCLLSSSLEKNCSGMNLQSGTAALFVSTNMEKEIGDRLCWDGVQTSLSV